MKCRLERSRIWALRCVHEASLYEKNCFITLTFRQACPWKPNLKPSKKIDPTYSLTKNFFPDFMKRLRFKVAGSSAAEIRYFHCGEYGEKLSRPHHHACLFNFDFPDKTLWRVRQGIPLYRSEILEELWPFGYSSIGAVTFESAAYVARYVTKKITGDAGWTDKYGVFHPGAKAHYNGRLPEFTTQSRNPGLANEWLKRFKGDVYPSDSIVIRNNVLSKPPKYYDRKYDLTNHDDFLIVKAKRAIAAKKNLDNTPERLAVKRELQLIREKLLIRGYENTPEFLKETDSTVVEAVAASGGNSVKGVVRKYVLKTGRLKRSNKCKSSISTLCSTKKHVPSPPHLLSPMMEKLLGRSGTLRWIPNPV